MEIVANVVLPRMPELKHPIFDDLYLNISKKVIKTGVNDDPLLTIIVDHIQPQNVLEVACGCGLTAVNLARAFPGAQICGIDLNEQYIALAKKEFDLEKITFSKQDAYLFKKPNTFDLVVSTRSLHHFDDISKLFGTIYENLQTNGFFVFADFNRKFMDQFSVDIELSRKVKMNLCYWVYHARTLFSDGDFVKYMQRKFGQVKTFSDQVQILVANSIIASYTPLEVVMALKEAGFKKPDFRMTLNKRSMFVAAQK
jgi:ubiquinone/menaquinone biosynthesis C-methylase UbiE